MSVTDIIYDSRFIKKSFAGYEVKVEHDKITNICVVYDSQFSIWEFHESCKIKKAVKDWLSSKGPYRMTDISMNNGTVFTFSRENTAIEFKLTFL